MVKKEKYPKICQLFKRHQWETFFFFELGRNALFQILDFFNLTSMDFELKGKTVEISLVIKNYFFLLRGMS